MRTSLRICAALVAASSSPAQELVGRECDGSVVLRAASYVDEHDRRDRLAMFVHRPVLVAVAGLAPAEKSRVGEYAKVVKRLDALAKSWRRYDVDVVLFVWPMWQRSGAKRQHLPVLQRAKPKHLIAAVVEIEESPPDLLDPLQDALFVPRFVEELRLQWVLVRDGKITHAGADVFEQAATRLVESLPERKDSFGKIDRHIDTWDFAKAASLIAAARGRSDVSENDLDVLDRRIDSAVASYVRIFIDPHLGRGYLPEAVAEWNRLIGWLEPGDRAARAVEQRESIEARSDYASVCAQREAFVALHAAYRAAERAVEDDYEKLVSDGYDEQQFVKCAKRHMPAVEQALRQYARDHQGSPYQRAVAGLLYDLRSMLNPGDD